MINDTILLVDFIDFFCRNIDRFYKNSRSRVETILEVTFVVEIYDLFICLRKLLVDPITVIETLSPFSNIIFSDSPTIKYSIFEFPLINNFLLLVHFAISIKFRVSKLPLINKLILKREHLTMPSNKREERCWRLTYIGRMRMNDELFISYRDGLFLS